MVIQPTVFPMSHLRPLGQLSIYVLSSKYPPDTALEIGQTFKANIKNIRFLFYSESPIKSRFSVTTP
jgi:hypothetical protein